MRAPDMIRQTTADIGAAFSLLTRLPVSLQAAPRADAAWAWPVAGVVVALVAVAVGSGAAAMGLPPGPAAGLALVTSVMLTGAMHEDGLADTADGLFGGDAKARRLAIMKDSTIGSFGAMALVLVTLIRWSALSSVLEAGHWASLVAIGGLSRVPMAVLLHALPNARGSGLSQHVGRPSRMAAAGAAALAAALVLVSCGWAGVGMIVMVALASGLLAKVAMARIGGQTGDILGASQQLAEAAGLCGAAIWLA